MRNSFQKVIALLMLAGFFLSACDNSFNHIQSVDHTAEKIFDSAKNYRKQAQIPDKPQNSDTVQTRSDIWLGDESFKIAGGAPLPAWCEKSDAIILSTKDDMTITELTSELTSMTGIRFDLNEIKDAKDGDVSVMEETFPVNFKGSLSSLLDYVSARLSVWWRYSQGVIHFYKMETRVFVVYALPSVSNFDASLGGSPLSNEGGATATAEVRTSTNVKDMDIWKGIEDGMKQIIGDKGEYVTTPSTGSITVTAPPYVMKKVAKYVQDINMKVSRQVAISVQIYQVELSNQDDYGFDLNMAFNSSKFAFDYAGAGTANIAGGGTMTFSILELGKWTSQDDIINALSTQGKTALLTSASVTTLNNKVAPVQVVTSENYVKETTVTTDSDSDGNDTSVELETDTLNYGFTMQILPRILDHGRLLILFSMTLTDLISLETFRSDGSTVSEDDTDDEDSEDSEDSEDKEDSKDVSVVQLPKLQTRGFLQEIAMKSGSTLVLTGFESFNNKTTSSGIGQQHISILGGSEQAQQSRNILVILITPEVLVSPLSPESRMENF